MTWFDLNELTIEEQCWEYFYSLFMFDEEF